MNHLSDDRIRLQKYMSECGVASRRKSEEIIAKGAVKVNGTVAKIGDSVDPKRDIITLNGKKIENKTVAKYIMLHKPRGFVTTMSDELGRRCVASLVEDVGERVYPIGRLDRNSEGLLLLTNDGEFANAVMHPSKHVAKVYRVTIRPDISDEQIAAMSDGMMIDGRMTAPAQVTVLEKRDDRAVIEIVLFEGRNRQIRRMCEELGIEVARLKRTAIAGVKLGMLPQGKWRELSFARRLGLQLRLNGLKPVTISVDNYFVERNQNPKDEFGNYDFECLEAIDIDLFNSHILKLLNGEEIKVPTFDFEHGTKLYKGNTMKLEDDQILVIEGIHCLNDKLTPLIPKEQKYKVYISALTVLNIDYYNRISTTDTRLIRRIVRDNQFRGYSALHTLKMWDSVNRGEERNIFPYQEEADSMFNSSLIYELAVLKDYAMPLLKEIDNSHPEFSEAKRIYRMLGYFESIPGEYVPQNSLLREFIGGSIFEE